MAWWHWTDDAANGAALGVAGQDLFNLSVSDVAGNDLITQNVGLKLKPNRGLEAGIAYEFPLTDFQDCHRARQELIRRWADLRPQTRARGWYLLPSGTFRSTH